MMTYFAARILGSGRRLSNADRVVLDTLLPSGAHPALPYGILGAGFDAYWPDLERTALPAWSIGFRMALLTASWIAPLLSGRLPPLSRYDRPARERMLAAMESSRFYTLRQMLSLLKTCVSFCYGADPSVRAAIGYPMTPGEPRAERQVAP